MSDITPHGDAASDPDSEEAPHPEAQALVGGVFFFFAAVMIALTPFATRPARIDKGWWMEPAAWPLLTLAIVLVASAVEVAKLVGAARAVADKDAVRDRALWAFRGLRPSLEYALYFCIYLFIVGYLGFALSSLIFLEFVVWRAGLRSWRWALAAFLFVVAIVLAFRVGIELWFPLAPIYEFAPDWFVTNIAIYL
jgi:hypothetical protein